MLVNFVLNETFNHLDIHAMVENRRWHQPMLMIYLFKEFSPIELDCCMIQRALLLRILLCLQLGAVVRKAFKISVHTIIWIDAERTIFC